MHPIKCFLINFRKHNFMDNFSDKLIEKRFECGQNVALNTFFLLIKCKQNQ